MLFNKNIILGILQDVFADEIEMYIDTCVMSFDEFELENIFESDVDHAIMDFIEEITVIRFEVEHDDDDDSRRVEGEFEACVNVDGYMQINGQNVCRESGVTVLGIGFEFCEQDGEYSDIELEYLY